MVENCRNSFSQLVAALTSWLPRVLAFVDSTEDCYEFRVALSLSPEVIEQLQELQLRSVHDRLYVREYGQDPKQPVDLVTSSLLAVWRSIVWSESRWATIGPSSRGVVASLALGLSELIDHVRSSPGHTDLFIKRFLRCSTEVKKTFVVGAMAGWVTSSALSVVMEDDRHPLVLDQLTADIESELQFVCCLPDQIADRLSEIAGCSSRELRSMTTAALVSASLIIAKVRPAAALPWSLLGPDKGQTLGELLDARAFGPDGPEDRCPLAPELPEGPFETGLGPTGAGWMEHDRDRTGSPTSLKGLAEAQVQWGQPPSSTIDGDSCTSHVGG